MGAGAHERAPGTLHVVKHQQTKQATARDGGDRMLLLCNRQVGVVVVLVDERAERGAKLCAWVMLDLGVGWGLLGVVVWMSLSTRPRGRRGRGGEIFSWDSAGTSCPGRDTGRDLAGGGMGTGDTMEDGWSLLGEAKLFEKMSERGRSRSWGGWVLL